MIIKKVAVGNNQEAYVETNLTDGFNIISSDDNNRGKTIIIQAMMYVLGNEPSFPVTFEYRNYYYYIEFSHNNIDYSMCRYKNEFVLKNGSSLLLFDGVSELKRYWTKNIFKLPLIIKNEFEKIVDPVLFLQLFFVGQDKKDTSNIVNNNYYKKTDFLNMIFAYLNISGVVLSQDEVESINNQIKQLKKDKKILLQKYKILKSPQKALSFLSETNDNLNFKLKITEAEKINNKITVLRKHRNNILNRKFKWQTTLKEINSLNRTIDSGELRCMDCNSTNIAFSSDSKATFTFEVSSLEMRKEIIASIQEKIDAFSEEIEEISNEIYSEQEKLKEILQEDSISLENIVAYKKNIFSVQDAEQSLIKIDEKINSLTDKLLSSERSHETKLEKQEAVVQDLIYKMQEYYQRIDAQGNLKIKGLFSKKDEIYSGSEATMFHLVRLLALQNVLQHDFPLIVDSFRAEDLSTSNENAVLGLFAQLSNQIIFTTTLKEEETGKYTNYNFINNIDYQQNQPSKILSFEYLDQFKSLLLNLSIQI